MAIDGATTIDVSGLAAGQYVVRIATDGGVTTHKLIKR
ncbi:MAG: T9SS type A sorting domain-containing protein [Bacteroidales bacterium]|nr:T9SS type A sorting domain-containing protein [Bacteroidales bacterium]